MKLRYNTTKTTIGLFMTTAICLTLAASAANAQTVYFADNFEEGLGKWEVAGDTWQLTELLVEVLTTPRARVLKEIILLMQIPS
jgi:hypothetical protein